MVLPCNSSARAPYGCFRESLRMNIAAFMFEAPSPKTGRLGRVCAFVGD